MAKRTLHKKRKNKQKTLKIKGGTIIEYNILSNEGFNASIVIPNVPFISNNLITKIGIYDEILKEYNSYMTIKKINNNQDEYDKMTIKVLCNPQPIMHEINFDLFKLINKNTDLFVSNEEKKVKRTVIKEQYTHGLTMKCGNISLMKTAINKKSDLFTILNKIKPIIESLIEINKNGYIHGDIKLNNILLFEENYYLIDLGTFIKNQNFKEDATNNKNALSIYLEHIPFESQYINNLPYIENNELFDINKKYYMILLSPFINIIKDKFNENDFITKYNNDINNTLQYSIIKKDEFIEQLFNKFDVFSIGLVIINILYIYNEKINNENINIIIQLYFLLVNQVFTYNLNERITMEEFYNKYNNIII
jgi:serine/threonine protein kinase